MENDDLTMLVTFVDGQGKEYSACFEHIHHAECLDGVLTLHSSEYGIVHAFSPAPKWASVSVQTPPRGLKPGEA
jgi:hypothetical protein